MYHIVKPLGEWRYHGCEPKSGARPMEPSREMGYAGREPTFDIHDVRPMSREGDEFLHRLHTEMYRREEQQRVVDPPYYGDPRPGMVSPRFVADFDNNVSNSMRKKKMAKMSHNKAMADALLDNFNTVNVYVDGGIYTYKVPKDMTLEEKDLVIIPRDKRMLIAPVQEAHDGIDNPDEINLKWIVGKLDTAAYDERVAQDKKALSVILDLEKRKTKRAMLSELTEDMSEEDRAKLDVELGLDNTLTLENK